MSISTISNRIASINKDIADLSKKISQETKKESDLSSKILQINKSITKHTSNSALNSKLSDIQRKKSEVAKIQSKKADLQKKESDKITKLMKLKQDLSKEEERERKKRADIEKKMQKEQLDFQKKLKTELHQYTNIRREVAQESNKSFNTKYDIFISHASEDKESFVKPLAESLIKLGLKIWYDEFTLKIGDSLRRSIDSGLLNSKYGVVILSDSFFAKNWTQYELDGMVTKEMQGHKVILPIWHKVSKDDVFKFSPTLADKVALNSSNYTIEEISNELKSLIQG